MDLSNASHSTPIRPDASSPPQLRAVPAPPERSPEVQPRVADSDSVEISEAALRLASSDHDSIPLSSKVARIRAEIESGQYDAGINDKLDAVLDQILVSL